MERGGSERTRGQASSGLVLPAWEVGALFAFGVVLFVLVPDPLWRASRDEGHLLRFVVSYFAVVPFAAWRLHRRRAWSWGALATVVGVVWAGKLLATVPLYHLFATSRRPDVHALAPIDAGPSPATVHVSEPTPGAVLAGRVTSRDGTAAIGVVALCDPGLVGELNAETRALHVRGKSIAPALLDLDRGDALVFTSDDGSEHFVRGTIDGVASFNVPVVAATASHGELRDVGAVSIEVDGAPAGWLLAFDHPWHARTGDDGRFSIADAPAGAHRLCFWSGGPKPSLARDVVVGSGRTELTLVLEGSPS